MKHCQARVRAPMAPTETRSRIHSFIENVIPGRRTRVPSDLLSKLKHVGKTREHCLARLYLAVSSIRDPARSRGAVGAVHDAARFHAQGHTLVHRGIGRCANEGTGLGRRGFGVHCVGNSRHHCSSGLHLARPGVGDAGR